MCDAMCHASGLCVPTVGSGAALRAHKQLTGARAAQVKLLLGFHVPRHGSCVDTARYLASHIGETVPLELAVGLFWLAVLLTMKHLGKTRRCF